MKKLIPFILLFFLNQYNCQYAEGVYSKSRIYNLVKQLQKGNKKAFNELTPYFDSDKLLSENLGYHYLETEEQSFAHRALTENFIYPDNELQSENIKNSKDFIRFLAINNDKIKYYPEVEAFYITPINQRKEFIEFRELPEVKLQKIKSRYTEILSKNWIKEKGIDLLIKKNNPIVFLKICEEFYRQRDKFNNYNRNKGDFHDLLRILIGKDIGSAAQNGNITWDTEDMNFDNTATLNLFVFFSKNYKNFKWNSSKNYFENHSLQVKDTEPLSNLIEDLYSENDSIAIQSYIILSQSDPIRVGKLCDEKEKNSLDRPNSITPLFPFRFLKQLSLFTNYCRQNTIDYLGSDELTSQIERLKSELTFNERRKLEDQLIKNLTFEDITSLEYWSLIHEKEVKLGESTARILDIYYTKNWPTILNNPDLLKWYLKKSILFSRIGINGSLNYYLIKFTGNGSATIKILDLMKSDDPDISLQIEKAKKICLNTFEFPIDNLKISEANFNSKRINIEQEIETLRSKSIKQNDFEYNILSLLAKIGYGQIPEAIKNFKKLKFDEKSYRSPYSFLERDYGFFMIKNWKSQEVQDQFLSIYNSHTEKQLYQYYLDKAKIDYKNKEAIIDYDKIFEILKFNIGIPFTGSSLQENEVGSIIKLLELELKTNLNYPDKLCNSAGIYICPPTDRAWEWQRYLIDNNFLKAQHSDIVSFHYGYYLDKVLPYQSKD